MGFSDDRHFALSSWGLIGVCAVACAAACGSGQICKLKVYRLHLDQRRIRYVPGTVPTSLGPLKQQTEGFMLTGAPLVIGDQRKEQLAKTEGSLGKLGRALSALWPAYLLVLRVVLAFVVSALNYVD